MFACGRKRSNAVSIRAWTLDIQAVKSLVVGTGEFFERIGIFFENLHLLLGSREDALAVLCDLQASLVRGEGLLEGQLPRLHAGDDFLQLREGRFEAFGLIGFYWLAHREQQNSPWGRGGQIGEKTLVSPGKKV
jgi:hypothetical protein